MPGDLSRLSQAVEDGSAEDVARAVEEGKAEGAATDEILEADDLDVDFSVLDFDLGGDEPAAAEARPEQAEQKNPPADLEEAATSESKPDAADDEGLHFDLDVGEVASDANVVEPTSDEDALKKTVLGNELDFSVDPDDDAPDLLSHDAPAPAPFDPRSLDATVVGNAMDLANAERQIEGDGDHISSSASDSSENAGANPTVLEQDYLRSATDDDPDSLMDLEKTGFDNSLLDFDFDLDTAPGQDSGKAPEMDFSTIDLDLELPEDAAPQVTSEGTAAKATAPAEPDESVSPEVQQEVETKLDLARAYEEMGDKDGARELIEEVLSEGSASQRELAKALLERLG